MELLSIICIVTLAHIFPIQLKFKGGKGVATFIGALLAYNYQEVILITIIFFIAYLILRKFTMSGLVALGIYPIIACFLGYIKNFKEFIIIIFIISIIILKHKENILKFKENIRKFY